MFYKLFFFVIVQSIVFFGPFAKAQNHGHRDHHEEKCEGPLSTHGKYSYDALSGHGPADWGKIKGYHMCAEGESQSPIDFDSSSPYTVVKPISKAPVPHMKLSKFSIHAKNDNWALDCDHAEHCGYTMFHGVPYYIANMHFHSPSEHTLDGKRFPLESHVVHASKAGNYVVIATLFDFEDTESFTAKVHNKYPTEYGTNNFLKTLWHRLFNVRNESAWVHIGEIVEHPKGFCVYNGSLTTPPCSENVHFFMQMNIQTVSRQQVHAYTKSVGSPMYGNFRPIQPLHNRSVTCYV